MDGEEFINITDFCRYHNIEVKFIRSLQDSGLVHFSVREKPELIPFSEIPQIERFVRMHYDLDINLEGIETIDYLLKKIESLQEELRRMHRLIHDDEPGL